MEVAEIRLGNESATKLMRYLCQITLLKRRIDDMGSDILAVIVQGIKNSAFPIALQMDESTDIAYFSQLVRIRMLRTKIKNKI